MKIQCPSCSENNEIAFAKHIECGKCKKTFEGHSYQKIKKPLISATTALILGASGAYYIDKHWIETPRYPIIVEHHILNICTNGSQSVLNARAYQQKTQVCACALKKTMNEINYSEFKKSEPNFWTRFESEVPNCG